MGIPFPQVTFNKLSRSGVVRLSKLHQRSLRCEFKWVQTSMTLNWLNSTGIKKLNLKKKKITEWFATFPRTEAGVCLS